LIEYGLAGLPVVATDVGQCAEALDQGQCGLLVPPSSPELLGKAILSLLQSSEKRVAFGRGFKQRVEENYGEKPIIRKLEQVYEKVLSSRRQAGV
jgi:glycosyltransferase involved in cell wall biosynthesis